MPNNWVNFKNKERKCYARRKQQKCLLTLNPGDIVIFRQDLPHQGMGYNTSNLRYFVYIDYTNGK